MYYLWYNIQEVIKKMYKKNQPTSYTLGITLTIELLKTNPKLVQMIYFHPSFEGDAKQKITAMALELGIKITTGTKIFNTLSQKENCYVIAEFVKTIQEVLKDNNHLVLVNPSDAGNMGTIMRSAVGFGFTDLVIITPAVDHYNPKVVRSSMGAIFHLKISTYESFEAYLNDNLPHDYFPFMLKAKASLNWEFIPRSAKPVALIFGNEATGLPDSFLNVGTPLIINHSKAIDSLNLPTAVGIALYEFSKNVFKSKSE